MLNTNLHRREIEKDRHNNATATIHSSGQRSDSASDSDIPLIVSSIIKYDFTMEVIMLTSFVYTINLNNFLKKKFQNVSVASFIHSECIRIKLLSDFF